MIEEGMDTLLLELEHYRRMWKILEDLETLLWNIKVLNDEVQAAITNKQ